MKQKPQDFGAIGAAPVLSSDKLERAGLRFSQWERLSPRQAYDGSTDARHVVAIHGSPGPVELSEYEPGGMNNGIARPGDIQIIPSGERAHCEWRQSLSFMKLEILPSKLEEVAAASGFGRSANLRLERRFLVQDPKLLQLSRWMLEELRSGGASGRLYWDSLSNLAAVHLLQHYTTSSQACLKPKPLTSAQVSRAIEFMHEHLEQDMTLEQLASAANVSLSHLVRLFKRHTGWTPHQYLIRLRVERAKLWIRCGQRSLKEIAAELGFSDQSHFTRMFKKYTGLTPMQYAVQSGWPHEPGAFPEKNRHSL